MKVILLKDVAKIGRRYEVVVVPDGFALNKLIPKDMAQAATPENLKRLLNLSSKQKQDTENEAGAFSEAISQLKDVEVHVVVEANNEGRMFQALKAEAIVEAVKAAIGFELGTEQIVMKTPIKSVGEHMIDLHSGSTHGVLTLNVTTKAK